MKSGVLGALVLAMAAPGAPRGPEQRDAAMAELRDAKGATVGDVELRQAADGVHVHVKLFGLSGGAYVLSAHGRGQCLPGFQASGPGWPRFREVPLHVGGDGAAESEFKTSAFAVAELKDWDGSSFLLSSAAAPNRPLACGVAEK